MSAGTKARSRRTSVMERVRSSSLAGEGGCLVLLAAACAWDEPWRPCLWRPCLWRPCLLGCLDILSLRGFFGYFRPVHAYEGCPSDARKRCARQSCFVCRFCLVFWLNHRYVGDWENDLQHGDGIFYFADSSCFQGSWVQVTHHPFSLSSYPSVCTSCTFTT